MSSIVKTDLNCVRLSYNGSSADVDSHVYGYHITVAALMYAPLCMAIVSW